MKRSVFWVTVIPLLAALYYASALAWNYVHEAYRLMPINIFGIILFAGMAVYYNRRERLNG